MSTHYSRGYDFGKDVIARLGASGIEEVKRQIEEAKDFGAYDEFDMGIEKAFQEEQK